MAAPLHTVMVPGLLCSARLYEQLLPTAWSHGSVTVADNRRDRTVGAMADRLLAAAPDRFVLVGLSMGGYVALEVVRRAPERVSGLALLCTSARADSDEQLASRREQEQAVLAGRFDELVEAVFPVLVDPSNAERADLADFWRTMAHEVGPDAFVNQLTLASGRPDSRPHLGSIHCPTAVVHGEGDRLITADHAVEAAAGVAGARLTLVPAAGHMLAQERPEALAVALDELFDEVAARSRPRDGHLAVRDDA